MPHSIARPAPRRFGQFPSPGRDRWPVPVAVLAILGLSAGGWFALLGATRALMALAG